MSAGADLAEHRPWTCPTCKATVHTPFCARCGTGLSLRPVPDHAVRNL